MFKSFRVAVVTAALGGFAQGAPIVFQNGSAPGSTDAYYFGPEGGVTNNFTTAVSATVSSFTFAVWDQVGQTPSFYLGFWSIQSPDLSVDQSDTFFSSDFVSYGSGTVVNSADTFNGPNDGVYDIRLVTVDLLSPFLLPAGNYSLTLAGVTDFGPPVYWGVAQAGTATAISFQSGPMPVSNFFQLLGPQDSGAAPELDSMATTTVMAFSFCLLAVLPKRQLSKARARS